MVQAPIWEPDANRVRDAEVTRFAARAGERWGTTFSNYKDLHRWSVDRSEQFWRSVWDDFRVIGDDSDSRVLADRDKFPGARWFPDARLNYAENLIRVGERDPDDVVIVFRDEMSTTREVSQRELVQAVASVASWLRERGVKSGDRVAGYLPNIPETIVAMLATSAIGAVWSSCSPDFGVQGVLDRFGQIAPKIFIGVDAYYYNGKVVDCRDKVREIRSRLDTVTDLVMVSFADCDAGQDVAGSHRWNDICHSEDSDVQTSELASELASELVFERTPFDHPLFIMYSSGTTGVPKCIVHGAGGVLLKHLTEHRLHSDIGKGDRVFYFTTCGWMMWNWLVSGLAVNATLILYDGSPFYPTPQAMFDLAAQTGITHFGTSAKFIDACNKESLNPARTHDLSKMKTLMSTGSPLVPESFDYVYQNIKQDLCLSSISGGTDIVGCFALGNPALPVWRGELQCLALGLDVVALGFDGKRLGPGERGELACLNPFPSVPVAFWNDDDGSKFHKAYFDRFENIWCHGDFVETTTHGGMIIHGRSDAVLNPGGVRIGTAEIYAHVEKLEDVLESVVIGQRWQGDVRVVLFVRLREGIDLNDALVDAIRVSLRKNASPRHVPAVVLQVADIPRTRSGKIAELAVRNVVHGDTNENREALANPEALELFANRPELGSDA